MSWHNLTLTHRLTSGAYAQCSHDQRFAARYAAGEVDYLPFVPNGACDLTDYSAYSLTAMNSYMIEYNAELVRKENFPLFPSRLSAIYAFGDYATCETVASKHGWLLREVRRFKLEEDSFTKVIKTNMEIVSLLRTANRISTIDSGTIFEVWSRYWKGESIEGMELPQSGGERKMFSCGELWEYLIEGSVALIE
jgi:hypothetical protein